MPRNFRQRPRVAVIGTGISGLSAAWLLNRRCEVTVYEAASRIGGHANTVDVTDGERTTAVDTGFIVFNPANYPNLTALFDVLGVATQPSNMSLSISLDEGALEYSGSNIRGLFAQKVNLVRPRFWSMLRDLKRFYREAPEDAAKLDGAKTTLGNYLAARGYGSAFQEDHLLPMAAAIWSAPARALLDFPAAAFIDFYNNHGLLRIRDRPEWRTVVGGSRAYVQRLVEPFAGRIRRDSPVAAVMRTIDGIEIRDAAGEAQMYDEVVIATHADQALAMLSDPSAHECALLGAFGYSRNTAVLHTDASLMPKRRPAWASWNYIGRRDAAGAPVPVTYWMNLLQGLHDAPDMFVTLNPPREPRPERVLHREIYEHPRFDVGALSAQRQLWSLQGVRNTWFCGAYFGAGFHEDGLQSGLAVAEALCGERRPWQITGESDRITMWPLKGSRQPKRCVA